MTVLLLAQQIAESGLHVDPAWVIAAAGTVLTTLTTTIAVLYRGQIAALQARIAWMENELKDRNVRIDTLIDQVGRAANAAERSVSLAERERERPR